MEEEQTKVFIVDDSEVAREMLTFILELDPKIKVIGWGKNGEEALRWLKKGIPDVITMDINMPILDGFETTRCIMETHPIPIVIVSSGYNAEYTENSFKAIAAGALAILEKPHGIKDEQNILELLHTIHMISGVKLIRRYPKKIKKEPSIIPASKNSSECILHTHNITAIAIGASLGGPLAVEKILSSLPRSLPVPIFLVQHISNGFTQGFANWLQKSSNLNIKVAKDNELALPGHVYIAPDRLHMTVKKGGIIALHDGAPEPLKPSIGKLFRSVAEIYGSHAIGVILTGMGKDGAQDLLLMREKGALTIAQDEKSCIMFGMPKEAILLGAAKYILPLEVIPEALLNLIEFNFLINEVI